MKLHFDSNQDYQIQAIKSVVDIFEGQPLNQGGFEFSISDTGSLLSENGIGNHIALSEEQILENLQKLQRRNDLPLSSKLEGMNFSVEMETGTGKTYVYLRTIYELNRHYGFKKFVIVVPSIAIREGAIKNLEITHDHFQNLYNKNPTSYRVYDSGRVSNLRGFASSNTIQILVINIDSFAKDENVINRPNDKLSGKKPIEFIRSTNPVVIVDEPQNMETPIRKKAIESLNPSCTLRYSATHTNRYNLIYSLDPVKAYDWGLVKQIEVDSVFSENDLNEAYVSLESFKTGKRSISARIKIDIDDKTGVQRKSFSIKCGDDLYILSNRREAYKGGFVIDEIDAGNDFITFTNGVRLYRGQSHGGLTDEIMKVQIQKAVEEHFLKEKSYKNKGIKVLTLFFIDRVANYRNYDNDGNLIPGKFAKWFEESFKEMSSKPEFKELINFPVNKVHNGYFAQDKKGQFKDSSEGRSTLADDDTYKLIMKNKEQLLDSNEPLRFIFSHSALREGWDNPNVFQICTLNETKSELKKRQEIGRGLRLPVDQEGNRIFDRNINRLTVIANECYEDFAKQLQKEIEEECGVNFSEGMIKNKRDRKPIKYRKGFNIDPKFLEIWDKIKYKTTYRVEYDTEKLIKQVSKALKELPEIKPAVIRTVKAEIKVSRAGVTGDVKKEKKTHVEAKKFVIPDILGYIQHKTELTRETIFNILKKSGRINEILINPQLFLDFSIREIKNALSRLMIDGIKYEKIGDTEYEMLLAKAEEIEAYIDKFTYKVKNNQKTIYEEFIPLDSEVENKFAEACEQRDDVEFYFKLPFWFKIKTPIGNYNPDWALIFRGEKKIYFVAETKSTTDRQKLREEEKLKIKCGESHFREFEDVEYRVVTSVSDLV